MQLDRYRYCILCINNSTLNPYSPMNNKKDSENQEDTLKEDRRIEEKNSHYAQAMALEEFTGYLVKVPWSLSGITGAGRYYCIHTLNMKKEDKI